MQIINEFMDHYRQEIKTYDQLARLCAQQCESGLERNGVRCMVTYRAKRPDRLKEKIRKRASYRDYRSFDDITKDIVDLAGIRIALYFPGDRDEVDTFIRSRFIVDSHKDFPRSQQEEAYKKSFSGYSAKHYRVRLRPESLAEDALHYANHAIEVQVGSVLMHAWAEVEHDLAYKPQTGRLSHDEYAILDELNGLVLAGEIALERLQYAVNRRIVHELGTFSNHYELSSFLYERAKATLDDGTDPIVGRADVLFRFLRITKLDSPAKLESYLSGIDFSFPRPLVEQVVDAILSKDGDLYQAFNEARLLVGESDPYGRPHESISYFSEEQALGFFMKRWIAVEKVLRKLIGEQFFIGDFRFLFPQLKVSGIDRDTFNKLQSVQRLRSQILHGIEFPSQQELRAAGFFLEEILALMIDAQPSLQDIVSKVIGEAISQYGQVD